MNKPDTDTYNSYNSYNDTDTPLYSLEEGDMDAPLYAIEDDSAAAEDFEEGLPENYVSTQTETKAEEKKKPSPLGVMLKTMFTPVEGWKALRRARFVPEKFASSCLYPLIGIASASEFLSMLWEANLTVSEVLVKALLTFMVFFLGYFTVLIAGGIILPKSARALLKSDVGKNFAMLATATLPLFYTLYNLFPMVGPVLVFLPLWTVYLVVRGMKAMRVDSEELSASAVLMCILIVGAPIAWSQISSALF